MDTANVERELKPHVLSIGTLSRLMDDCLPAELNDEKDMERLIKKIWPALVCEQSTEEPK